MPLRNEVRSLEELCKKNIHELLVLNRKSITKKGYQWRLLFVGNISGNLRTDLLCYGFTKNDDWWNTGYTLQQWVPESVTLFDSSIRRVPHICVYDLKADLQLLVTFVSYLWIYRPKLNELLMDLLYVHKNCLIKNSVYCIRFAMNILSNYFDEGLAKNLVNLQLTYQCDDSMLHAIGRHAKHLKSLDVSCSTKVTANGIKQLLFKDHMILNDISKESKMDQLYAFLRTLKKDQDVLNTVCFTLEELRVQYTKADNVAWILILSCIYNLKQIGWPGKWNIMKVIMTVWREILKPLSRHLQLHTLSDWEISYDEIYVMTECMPHLTRLSTSLTQSYGPLNNIGYKLLLKFWNNLRSLTLFMENTMSEHFQMFCKHGYTKNLSELTIKTFSSDIVFDLALLQSSCPNLITLDIVSMTLHINREPTGKFHYLKKVVMESPPAKIKSWFLHVGCPILEELKIFNEIDYDYWKNIFNDPPPLIRKNITNLEIIFVIPDGYMDYIRPSIFLNHSIITGFIEKCSVLNTFGSILTIGMSTHDVACINNFVRLHNYSLTIY